MGPKPHIVMLANGHAPFDPRIFFKEARTLEQAGYNVSLIIPHAKDEVKDNISLLAVPLTSKGWQKLTVNPWNILKRALMQPSGAVYHIHDSDILVVGIVLKLLGRKVIYDAHEDTPLQIMYQHWLPGILKLPYRWFYFMLEKLCGLLFDRIIVAEPIIARYFPKKKTSLIRNFPIIGPFRLHKPVRFAERKPRLVNIGTLSEVRGLLEMLDGAQLASGKANFEFVLGGKFSPPKLKEVLANYKVTFLSWVSFTDMVDLLFDARAGIIIFRPVKRYRTNYPVKLFEFMAAGLPVIVSNTGEAAQFVQEAQCGILVDPMNTAEIAEAIIQLFTHPAEAEAMGRRGQELVFRKYNWETEGKVLLNVYAELFPERS